MSGQGITKGFFIAVGTLIGIFILCLMYVGSEFMGLSGHILNHRYHTFIYFIIYLFYTIIYFILGVISKRPNVGAYIFSFNIFLPFIYGIILHKDPLNKFAEIQGGVTLYFTYNYFQRYFIISSTYLILFLLLSKEIIKYLVGYDLQHYDNIDKYSWKIETSNDELIEKLIKQISSICDAFFNDNYTLDYVKDNSLYEIGTICYNIKGDVILKYENDEDLSFFKNAINSILINYKAQENNKCSKTLYNKLQKPLNKKDISIPRFKNIKISIKNFPKEHPVLTPIIALIFGTLLSEVIRYFISIISIK